ncbi:ComF family protein [Caballeronia ptereochthonis]|uniref:ComF family protein n=1 Tax=Caballeronia ptereochthonis TaxID=1777144 RepID=A0A158CPR4_9BURK|nr:ComF family protein [Caballeronia ptereochthonis]SAK83846.1 ComF family protein [Caballeronia ptereochthonis]
MAARARRFAAAAKRLACAALPGQCALCGNLSQGLLCDGCDAQYWNEPRLRCATCALPLASSYVRRERDDARPHCAACLESPPAFNDTLALADYRAPLDTLAVELKFRARLAAGAEFARHLHAAFEDSDVPLPDVIVPVPLSGKRLVARGYNQAWAIARPLARRLGVRSDASLVARVRHTSAQSRLDLDTRRRNVASAFSISGDVRGKHVGVVDDVMTSGATLDAVARALKLSGARRVTNFVALRTPQD